MKSSSQQWPLIKNAVFLYPSANSVWYLITYLDVWYLEQVGCPVADADWQSLSSQAQACSFYYRAQPHMERAAGKEIEISSCLSSAFLVKHINYSPCYFIKALWQRKPFSEDDEWCYSQNKLYLVVLQIWSYVERKKKGEEETIRRRRVRTGRDNSDHCEHVQISNPERYRVWWDTFLAAPPITKWALWYQPIVPQGLWQLVVKFCLSLEQSWYVRQSRVMT